MWGLEHWQYIRTDFALIRERTFLELRRERQYYMLMGLCAAFCL